MRHNWSSCPAGPAQVRSSVGLRNVSGTIVSHRGDTVRLACSIGVATMRPAQSSKRSEFLQEADDALYAAKVGRGYGGKQSVPRRTTAANSVSSARWLTYPFRNMRLETSSV